MVPLEAEATRSTWALAAVAAFLCVWAGCAVKDIDATYGKRRGAEGGASVNGTGVLADMFEQRGHRVTTKRLLTPRIEEYGAVVWAPDDFSMPEDDYLDFFEDWLVGGRNRTLIYIGRDYDAAITYWEEVRPAAPPEQRVEVTRRLAKARARHQTSRMAMPADETGRWFRVRRDRPARRIGSGQDRPPPLRGAWCRGQRIDGSRLEIQVEGTLEMPSRAAGGRRAGGYRTETLLAAGDEVLAWRITNERWPGGRIIVVTNGSFLLNLPLVRKEHRKLADRLIAECEPSAKVAFLESGPGGPPLLNHDPSEDFPTGLEAFTVWPIGAILLHVLALGILYVFGRLAIFGRPHELPPDALSDFGKHIGALGQLLARTQDRQAAQDRLAYYREKVKRESGGVSRRCSTAGGTDTVQAGDGSV